MRFGFFSENLGWESSLRTVSTESGRAARAWTANHLSSTSGSSCQRA